MNNLKQPLNTDYLRKVKPKILWGIVLLLIAWQAVFYQYSYTIKTDYARRDATGLAYTYAKKFFYFQYYTGNFPLIAEKEPTISSEKEAQKIIEEGGPNLLMEYKHWARLGDSGRIFMFYPDAWLYGKVINPDVKTFNALLFLISLLCVLIAFNKSKQFFIGLLYVIIVGSSQFWLYEVYVNQNLFPIIIINFNFLLALFLPLILNATVKHVWIHLLFAGIVIGLTASIRSEVKSMLVACFAILLMYKQQKIVSRVVSIGIMFFSFYLTSIFIQNYFDTKFENTYQLVKEQGGIVYDGPRINTHKFWHPVFVFLGDFDTKFGYGPRVNDTVAYRYAVPILNQKYGMNLNYTGQLYLDDYYDSTKKYYKKFDEIDEYEAICKEKVLNDIKKDPLWYIEILFKRIWNNLTMLSPISISFFKINIPIPFTGLFIFIAIPFLWFKQNFDALRLVLFSIPISLASIIIYAKDNITFNHVYHIILFCLFINFLAKKTLSK